MASRAPWASSRRLLLSWLLTVVMVLRGDREKSIPRRASMSHSDGYHSHWGI